MPHEITFSELNTYAMCPWQWHKKYVELKRPKIKNIKLSFGTAVHKGIEAFYEQKGNPVDVVKEYCDDVRRKANADGFPVDDEYGTTLDKTSILMKAYAEHYAGDFEKFKVLTVEPTFKIPLMNDIWIVGKIDRILIEKRTGIMYPVETKTVASWDADVNRLMLDFQISLYSWAISKMLKLEDVTFIYDVIKKPSLRQKMNESLADFMARIERDINEDKPKYFIRDKITRSRREIERTEGELLIRCQELIEKKANGKVYRTPGDHCHWACAFMPPCLEDSLEMWENLYYTEQCAHPELTAAPDV